MFYGSSPGLNPIYSEEIEKLSKIFIAKDFTLVYGGAKVGHMGKLADHILSLGGKVKGIIPKFLKEKKVAHNGLTELIEVSSMHERKELMEKQSDGFIALPGGFGTIEEIFEMVTWGQLRLHEKPCGFLNINGFYDLSNDFLENTVKEGFIEREFKNTIIIDSDVGEIVDQFIHYQHHTIDKAKKALNKTFTATTSNRPT